jgi:hypothetical protein
MMLRVDLGCPMARATVVCFTVQRRTRRATLYEQILKQFDNDPLKRAEIRKM